MEGHFFLRTSDSATYLNLQHYFQRYVWEEERGSRGDRSGEA